MNRTTIIIFLFLFILSCKSKQQKIESIWFSKNQVSHIKADTMHLDGPRKIVLMTNPNKNALYHDTFPSNQFYRFENDSLTILVFNETFYWKYSTKKLKYNLSKSSLILNDKKGNPFIMKLRQLNEKKLILSYKNEENEKFEEEVFREFKKINRYKQKVNKDALDKMLVSSEFKIEGNESTIEFTAQKKNEQSPIFTSDLNLNFGFENNWYSTIFEEELFLVLGDEIIQIIEITKDVIVGETFDRKIKLLKNSSKSSFELELLKGNWQSESNNSLIDRETKLKLEISDSLIYKYENSKIDTLIWSKNKYNNKLIFNDLYQYSWHDKNYWNIIELTEKQLKVERLQENIEFPKIEQFTLIKERNNGVEQSAERQ